MTLKDPWLSVLMPIFNGAQTLSRTLESMLGHQEGIEVIAVDQASSDSSHTILEGFRPRLNIKIIEAPQNVNWMQNTNLGLSVARAPYCTMLHQDDIWFPGRTQELRGLVTQYPNAAMWAHNAWFIDANDRPIGRFGPPFGRKERLVSHQDALSPLLVQNTLALPAVMFRRDLALQIGGLDETLWYTADWDFWLKMLRSQSIAWSPSYLAGFRLHDGSLTVKGSRNLDDFRSQMTTVLDRHIGSLPSEIARTIRPVADAAISVNVCLAGAYHRQPANFRQTLVQVLSLGVGGITQLIHDSQILSRVGTRLKARLWD